MSAYLGSMSTDIGPDPPFPNHTFMHGAGRFGLASLRNLDQLPATGAVVIAAPLAAISVYQSEKMGSRWIDWRTTSVASNV